MAVRDYGFVSPTEGMGNALRDIAMLKQRDRTLAADEQSNALMQQRFQAGQDENARLREQEQTRQLAAAIYDDVKAGNPRGIAAGQAIMERIQSGLGAQFQDPAMLASGLARVFGFEDQESGGIKIGQYNPGDYTPQSWAQFLQSKDPGGLQRQYAPAAPPQPILVNTPAYGAGLVDRHTGQPIAQFTTPEAERNAKIDASAAEAEGKATVENNTKSAEKQAAWNLYQTAMEGLRSGLEGSVTGPVSGRVPAVTAAQQTAEGGVAAMAPVLKQLFRVAGEGVFTDRDQQLLLDMVPKRTDLPEARTNKIANIDAIVRAKLGIGPAAEPAKDSAAAPKRRRYNPNTGAIE